MTHDELLNVLWYGFKHTNDALDDVLEDKGDAKELQHQLWTYKALRAVVELTKESLGKEKIDFEDDQYDQFDEAYWGGYDAGKRSAMNRIIQAIEKELK